MKIKNKKERKNNRDRDKYIGKEEQREEEKRDKNLDEKDRESEWKIQLKTGRVKHI